MSDVVVSIDNTTFPMYYFDQLRIFVGKMVFRYFFLAGVGEKHLLISKMEILSLVEH